MQIRTLRLRRAVLMAVTRRGSTHEEMDLMHKLAKLSEDERRRLIGDFLDTAFGGLDANPGEDGFALREGGGTRTHHLPMVRYGLLCPAAASGDRSDRPQAVSGSRAPVAARAR